MNSDKVIVGPFNSGLQSNREPFFINNDSFPVLINAYQWRGRIKRKRGTSQLGRLTRYFNSTISSYGSTVSINIVANQANVISGFGFGPNATLVPESAVIVGSVTGQTYRDTGGSGFLTPTGTGGPNTINYATGVVTIPAENGGTITLEILYYPNLPVMGLEDLNLNASVNPGTIAFNPTYSFNINTTFPYSIYDISFYKNPGVSMTSLPGYVPKTTWTPTTWNGQNYQQFWTINYQGAFWATNGMTVPFNPGNMGMQFKKITGVEIVNVGNGTTIPAVADITIVAHGLVQGDFVFINEVQGITGINFQTGYVTSADPQAVNVVRVTLPFAILGGVYTIGGIAQYLTNRSDTTKDCIRWYDGDPTDGDINSPTFVNGNGWVNFMPPLSRSLFSIAELPAAQYYLVGSKIIQEFKDRLVFIGPVVQSSTGSPIYLQDVVIYSQNGTAFYTASFKGDPSLANTVFSPILVPTNQTATPNAYWEDQTGFGGNIQAGIEEAIVSVAKNEDVLILGAPSQQMRLVYTGNDLIPFNFYLIDSDLSTRSTFSAVNMGSGVITRGERGIILTTQRECNRIDTIIPDKNFQVDETNNGNERYTAIRDFLNEWIYFTYPSNQNTHVFPTETLFYNYRDQSWATFNEAYTTYGQFRKRSGLTWATVGAEYPTWESWTTSWISGASTVFSPEIIAGNQQGFVIFRDQGTNEAKSLFIKAITYPNIDSAIVTVPDHCLIEGDYIVVSDAKGVNNVNGRIFNVGPPITKDSFKLFRPFLSDRISGTYIGNGVIKKIYNPFIQTKQFPTAWGMGRKTRIGTQKYLLTTTAKSQITLYIYLSENSVEPYNSGEVFPTRRQGFGNEIVNDGLIYSSTLYTCPESTNIGLTPISSSLMFIDAGNGTTGQQQIWHRINTSLIGDTIQLGFTMSPKQLQDSAFTNQFAEIELHGFILDVYPSQLLC